MRNGLKTAIFLLNAIGLLLFFTHAPAAEKVIRSYSLDDAEGLLAVSGIEIDRDVFSQGQASLRVTTDSPVVVRLFETDDIDVENARLIYQARVKTDNVKGSAYLEMWCRFPGKGEFFSRGLDQKLKGDHDWTLLATPFFLRPGENPDKVRLNLVINGQGTVWIDDIRLLAVPLK
jgi:hypothetical protein